MTGCTPITLVNSGVTGPKFTKVFHDHWHWTFWNRNCDNPIRFGIPRQWMKVSRPISPILTINWLLHAIRKGQISNLQPNTYHTTQCPFNGLLPGQSGYTGTRKVTIQDFNEARNDGWQRHQLNHMQIICTSLQTNNHVSTSPLSFHRTDALPATQP